MGLFSIRYNFYIEIISYRIEKVVKYGYLLNINNNNGYVFNTRVSPSYLSNNEAFIKASSELNSKMEELIKNNKNLLS